MDVAEAWIKAGEITKTARLKVVVANGSDVLAGWCAPVAERWDAAAARRDELRTPEHLKGLMKAQREYNSTRVQARSAAAQRRIAKQAHRGNPLAGPRRSARTADKAAKQTRSQAESELMAARQLYPKRLLRRAVELHAAHAVPTIGSATALTMWQGFTVWPVSMSAVAIAANVTAVKLGRRGARPLEVEGEVSAEERALMERLDPSYWVQHAPERGLEGTVSTPPAVGVGGITCEIRLDGKWTVKALADKADSIQALLGARSALRMRITGGSRGGWAVLTLATRKATDGTSAAWSPDLMPADPLMMSIGVDTETGEHVLVPFDERMLIAGASGTGKSWSTRPLLATAHLRGDLVLIDGKGEEATVWESVCRVAVEVDEVTKVIDEIHAEMTRRKRDMKRRGISVWDKKQLTVLVDEGQVVLALVMGDKERLQRLVELSSLGRSRGIVLWWATQKPVMSGGAPGVHNLIAPNLLTRFSLRVADAQEAQTALDDCAEYQPQKIDRGKEWRGHGYLKDYGPRIIRTWTLNDAGVKSLPAKQWQASGSAPAEETPTPVEERPALRLVKAEAEVPAQPAGSVTNRDRILGAIQAGASTGREVSDQTGLNKGTVSREVKRLVESGAVRRTEDGVLVAGEVSA